MNLEWPTGRPWFTSIDVMDSDDSSSLSSTYPVNVIIVCNIIEKNLFPLLLPMRDRHQTFVFILKTKGSVNLRKAPFSTVFPTVFEG